MPPDHESSALKPIGEDLWLIQSPLSLLGANVGRNTAIIRINQRLLIHSTAPLSEGTWQEIQKLGAPAWVLESTLYHDTYTAEFAAQHPDLIYLLPEGFKAPHGITSFTLNKPPLIWASAVDLLLIEGVPSAGEYAFLHRPSRTLIVADLIFNISPNSSPWLRFLLRAASGLQPKPDMSRLYKMAIKDRAAFSRSIKQLLEWDFDQVIVGHGEPIQSNGKEVLHSIWQHHGYL